MHPAEGLWPLRRRPMRMHLKGLWPKRRLLMAKLQVGRWGRVLILQWLLNVYHLAPGKKSLAGVAILFYHFVHNPATQTLLKHAFVSRAHHHPHLVP